MDPDIRSRMHEFTDDFLIEQYAHRREEYTAEALSAMEEELAARNISESEASPMQRDAGAPRRYASEDFVPLEHTFSHVDLLLAQTVLREHGIPFFVDIPAASSMLPLESQISQRYTIRVLEERREEALEVLGEHFSPADGEFSRKDQDARDRIRSFDFQEIALDEMEHKEVVDVAFSGEERSRVLTLVERLLGEAETVEERRDRLLFYFDNLEEVKQALVDSRPLTRAGLLTILEVLQVYCDEDDFPRELESVGRGILDFLAS